MIYYSTGLGKRLNKKGAEIKGLPEATASILIKKGFVVRSLDELYHKKQVETDVLQNQEVTEENTQEKEPEYSVKLIKPEKPEKTPKAKPKAKPVKRGRKK